MVLDVINYIDNKENVCVSPKVGYKRKPLEYQEKASPFTPKRRLMFVDKVFQGEIFYIDPKTLHSTSVGDIERKLTLLGGRVEKFMCKDVTCVISDRKDSIKLGTSASVNSPSGNGHKFSTMSPIGGGSTFSPTPMSRGQALLMKSNLKNSSNKFSKGCTDVLSTAKQLGIKILDLKDILKQINREVLKCDPNAKWSPTQLSKAKKQSSSKKVKPIKGNYIKFEHDSGNYKPVYGKITSFPVIEVSPDFEGCPFDPDPKKDHKPAPKVSHKSKTNVKPIAIQNKNRSKVKKDRKPKSGYCESCESYFSDLRQHMISKSHLDFIANKENFKSLDTYLTSLPSIPDLLSSFTSVLVPQSDISSSSTENRCKLDSKSTGTNNGQHSLQPAQTSCIENVNAGTNYCVIDEQLCLENNNLKILSRENSVSVPNGLSFHKGTEAFDSIHNSGQPQQSLTENVTKLNQTQTEGNEIMSLDFDIGNLEFNLFPAGPSLSNDFQNSNVLNTVSQDPNTQSKDSSIIFADMKNVDFGFSQTQATVVNANVSFEKSVLHGTIGKTSPENSTTVEMQPKQKLFQEGYNFAAQTFCNQQVADPVVPQSIDNNAILQNEDSNKPLTFKDFSYSDVQNLDIMPQGEGSHHNISSLLDQWNSNEQLGSKLGSKLNSIIENIVGDNIYKSSSDKVVDKQTINNCDKSSNDTVNKSANSFLDVLRNSLQSGTQTNLHSFTKSKGNTTFSTFANIAGAHNQMSDNQNGSFANSNLFAQGISDLNMLNKVDGDDVKNSNMFLDANFFNARKFSEISEVSDPNMKLPERVFGSNIAFSKEGLVNNSHNMIYGAKINQFSSSFHSGDSLSVHKSLNSNIAPPMSTSGPPVLSVCEPIESSHVEYSDPPDLTLCKSASKSACDMKSNNLSKLTVDENKSLTAPCLTEMEPCSGDESDSSSSTGSSSDTLCTSSESGSSSSSSNSGSEPGALLSQLIPSKPVFKKAANTSRSLLMEAVTNSFKLLTPRRRKKREGSKLDTSEMSVKEDENQQSELCQVMGDCSLHREVETGLDILKQLCDGFVVEQEEETLNKQQIQVNFNELNKLENYHDIDIDNTCTEDMNKTLTCDQTVKMESESQQFEFISDVSEKYHEKDITSPVVMYDDVSSCNVLIAKSSDKNDYSFISENDNDWNDNLKLTCNNIVDRLDNDDSQETCYSNVECTSMLKFDNRLCNGATTNVTDNSMYLKSLEILEQQTKLLEQQNNEALSYINKNNEGFSQDFYDKTKNLKTPVIDHTKDASFVQNEDGMSKNNKSILDVIDTERQYAGDNECDENVALNMVNNQSLKQIPPEWNASDNDKKYEDISEDSIKHNVQHKYKNITTNHENVTQQNNASNYLEHNVSNNHEHNVSNSHEHNVSNERNVSHYREHNVSNNHEHNVSNNHEHNVSNNREHNVSNNREHNVSNNREHNVSNNREHNVSNNCEYKNVVTNHENVTEQNNVSNIHENCVLDLAVKRNNKSDAEVSTKSEAICKGTKQKQKQPRKQTFVNLNSPLDLSVKPKITKESYGLEDTPPSKKCLPFKKRMITFQTSKTYSDISQGSITAINYDESSISADPVLLRKCDETTEIESSKLVDSNAIFSTENVFRKGQELNSDSRLVPLVDDSTCDSAIIDVCGISDSECAPVKATISHQTNTNSATTEEIGFHKFFSKEHKQQRKRESIDGYHDDTSRSSLSRANSFESSCSLKSASSGYHSEIPNPSIQNKTEIAPKRKRGRPKKNPDLVVPAKKKAKIEPPLICYDASVENSLQNDGFVQPLTDITSKENITNGKRKKVTRKRKSQNVSDIGSSNLSDNGSTVCAKSIQDILYHKDSILDIHNTNVEKSTVCEKSFNNILGTNCLEQFQENNRISSNACGKSVDQLLLKDKTLPKPKKIKTNSSETLKDDSEKWKVESLGGLKLKVFKLGSLTGKINYNSPADSLTNEMPNNIKQSVNNKRQRLEHENIHLSEGADIYNVKPKKKKQRKKEVMQFIK